MVEHRDALVRRHVGGRTLGRDSREKIDDRLFCCPFVPARQGIDRQSLRGICSAIRQGSRSRQSGRLAVGRLAVYRLNGRRTHHRSHLATPHRNSHHSGEQQQRQQRIEPGAARPLSAGPRRRIISGHSLLLESLPAQGRRHSPARPAAGCPIMSARGGLDKPPHGFSPIHSSPHAPQPVFS